MPRPPLRRLDDDPRDEGPLPDLTSGLMWATGGAASFLQPLAEQLQRV